MPAVKNASDIKSAEDLTPHQKAAILTIVLGDDLSPKVLSFLPKQDIEAISKEIAFMKTVDPKIIRQVVDEFYKMLKAKNL